MANIAKRPDGRWRARYRDPRGEEHARHFALHRTRSARSRPKMISVGQHRGNNRPENTHRLPNVSNARSPVNSRAPATTNHRQRPSARPVTAEVAGSSPVGVAI